jgi:tight adherence protein B
MTVLDHLAAFGQQPPLLYAALVSGILLLVDGVYRLLIESRVRSEERINRRLRLLADGADPRQVLNTLRRSPEKKPDWVVAIGRIIPLIPHLDQLIVEAGSTISLTRLLVRMAVIGLFVFALTQTLLSMPIWGSLLLAVPIGVVSPISGLVHKRRKRLAKFAEQLPDALELLVRTLRVGHPLSSSIALIANEMPDPIGTEFGIAFDEMTYGLGLKEAMENLGRRIDVPDLRYMIVAINIQYGSGGNLAEILDGLSKIIRARFNMYRKIRAVSAEGRASAVFLTFFPVVPVVALFAMQPGLYRSVSDHPYFMPLMILGFIMLILNTILMRAVIKIKV